MGTVLEGIETLTTIWEASITKPLLEDWGLNETEAQIIINARAHFINNIETLNTGLPQGVFGEFLMQYVNNAAENPHAKEHLISICLALLRVEDDMDSLMNILHLLHHSYQHQNATQLATIVEIFCDSPSLAAECLELCHKYNDYRMLNQDMINHLHSELSQNRHRIGSVLSRHDHALNTTYFMECTGSRKTLLPEGAWKQAKLASSIKLDGFYCE